MSDEDVQNALTYVLELNLIKQRDWVVEPVKPRSACPLPVYQTSHRLKVIAKIDSGDGQIGWLSFDVCVRAGRSEARERLFKDYP